MFFGRPYWGDVLLCEGETTSEEFFGVFRQNYGVGAGGAAIEVIIRRLAHPGPNSVADFERYYKMAAADLEAKEEEAVALEVFQNAINAVEPLTHEPITSANVSNFVPIRFEDETILLLDLKEFIVEVLYLFDRNRTILGMCFPKVKSKSGEVISVDISQEHWEECLFPHSEILRDRYDQCEKVVSVRHKQLTLLHDELPHLFSAVMFWIYDLRNFDEAKEMLQISMEVPGVSPLMSPAYFTSDQARRLGCIYMEGSRFMTLKEVLAELWATHKECSSSSLLDAEYRKERDELFWGTQLPDKLQEVLNIDSRWFESEDFLTTHKSELKKRLRVHEGIKSGDAEQPTIGEASRDDSQDNNKENVEDETSSP
ncbi:MAG: hypothetical protein SGILL_001130 [Bacillariaceae sp.]